MFLVIVPWCAHTTKCVLIENCGRPYRADLNTLTHTDKKTTHANKNCILSGKWRPCLGSPSIHTPKLQKMSITAIDLIASPAASCTIISFRSQNCSGPSKDPSCGRAVRPPCTPQPLYPSPGWTPALLTPCSARRVPARVLERERASVSCAMLSEAYRAKLQCRWHPPPSSAPLSAPPAAAGPPDQARRGCGELQLRRAAQARGMARRAQGST